MSGREQEFGGSSSLEFRAPGFLSLILLARRFWNHTWGVGMVSDRPASRGARGPSGAGGGGRALTCTTRMSRPVSEESCSLTCRAGFGEFLYAFFSVSSCFAVMVVRGRLAPASESSVAKTTVMQSAEEK